MSTPRQDINSITDAAAAQDNAAEKDTRSQSQIDYEEGRGYVERGETSLAAVSLHNALRGFEEEDNKEGVANASNQLGHVCLQREEFEKALEHYQRAWEICEDRGDHMSLQAISLQLVEVHVGLKDYRRSLDVCLDLLDEYHKNNDPGGSVRVMERMADVYLASGDTKKAADTYETIASIHGNFKHDKIAETFRQKAAELKT